MAGRGAKAATKEPTEDVNRIPGTEDEHEQGEGPFPDGTQLALKGVKPDAIKAVEKEFDACVDLKAKKAKTDSALKDQKEKLRETMIENGIPTYGKKYGKERWVADTHEKSELTLKRSKPDRD